jgi:cytochrome c-type biogenesis protein CcmE
MTMHPTRRRRLWTLFAILLGVGAATAFALAALRQNLQHFYSPTEVVEGKAPRGGQSFRLGGVVTEGSVKRATDSLRVEFLVTDRFETTTVQYEGILPDLFREGQSVVTTGSLRDDGTFVAREVLAKHDETYMPREVADAIAKAKARKQGSVASDQGSGEQQ